MTSEQLNLVHKALSDILILLRDNPEEDTNPQMFKKVTIIIDRANHKLAEQGNF